MFFLEHDAGEALPGPASLVALDGGHADVSPLGMRVADSMPCGASSESTRNGGTPFAKGSRRGCGDIIPPSLSRVHHRTDEPAQGGSDPARGRATGIGEIALIPNRKANSWTRIQASLAYGCASGGRPQTSSGSHLRRAPGIAWGDGK